MINHPFLHNLLALAHIVYGNDKNLSCIFGGCVDVCFPNNCEPIEGITSILLIPLILLLLCIQESLNKSILNGFYAFIFAHDVSYENSSTP